MIKETMTVHRALSELKVLENRIEKLLDNVKFCVANKHSNKKINGVGVSEYKEDISSEYMKITDLIKRRGAIKKALSLSNAITDIEVAGVIYKVAELIEMNNNGITFKEDLLSKMERDYNASVSAISIWNEQITEKAENYVTGLYGSKENLKNADTEVENMRRAYIEQNSMDLIDGIGIKKEIDRLKDEIDNFKAEVNSKLSEVNALTVITVEY